MTILVALLLLCAVHTEAETSQDVVSQIIAARHHADYHECDYYSCARYMRTQLALNDVDPFKLNGRQSPKKHSWLQKTAIKCGLNNKFVLPLMTEQRVEELSWRKSPERSVTEQLAINREGLNQVFDSGDILGVFLVKNIESLDIYADELKIHKLRVMSPLGTDAMKYYDYDVDMTADSIANIMFQPKAEYNDFLSGHIIAVKDSLWRVKLVKATLPTSPKEKIVDVLYISQEYGKTAGNRWLLRKSEILVELKPSGIWGKLCYVNSRQYSHFSTDTIPEKKLRGQAKYKYNALTEYRTSQFWQQYDENLARELQQQHEQDSLRGTIGTVEETSRVQHVKSYAQERVDDILRYVQDVRGIGLLAYPVRALVNNYIPIGHPEWFTIEPVTSLVSFNDIDNLRLRFGGYTTANLNRNIFLGGYIAYGFRQRNVYYNSKVTYSFRKKNYAAEEFPRRNISIQSRYDIGYLGERTDHGDHDDLFKSFHWDKKTQMMFFKMQKIALERDEMNGIGSRLSIKHEEDRATGGLIFKHLKDISQINNGYSTPEIIDGSLDNGTIKTTEIRLELLYCPQNGRYYSRKQLMPVNAELPSIGIAHTIGMKILGGEYKYHLTELKVVKRWFLWDYGIGKSMIKAGALWNTVPYPLLLAPPANISYVSDEESFSLIGTSEFINDKYLQVLLSWETNGNLIGKIPLIKRLRWKEYLAVHMLWGRLSYRNNPYLPENADSEILMPLPKNVYIMEPTKPYVEGIIGIHNIFHILNIDYIHRFSYRNLPNTNHGGIRVSLKYNF